MFKNVAVTIERKLAYEKQYEFVEKVNRLNILSNLTIA